MSDNSTKRMLSRLQVMAGAPMYMASGFRTPPENFHTEEYVEIDIERDDEAVAVVVTDLTANGNANDHSEFVNKQWTPPIYKERATVSAFQAIKRQAGASPFQPPDYKAVIMLQVQKVQKKLINKIRRAIELQAAQVKQTGILTLKNSAGVNLFTLDFKPKSTHFPTAGNDWGGGSETPLADLGSLARVIRRDGKKRPNKLTFGRTAWTDFLADSEVQAQFDNRRFNLGNIEPRKPVDDAAFMGEIRIDNYPFEMWIYDAEHKDVQTGNMVPYITDDLVLMEADSARFDLTYGAIPQIPGAESRALAYVPAQAQFVEQGVAFTTYAWFSEDGTKLTVEVSTRPLTIPTEIDAFGALNTRA